MTTEAANRMRRILGQREGFIIPVRSVKLQVVESLFDGDPDKDFAIIVSKEYYDDIVITEWIAEQSGLEDWYIVPGYPFQNADGLTEWKTVRRKDW